MPEKLEVTKRALIQRIGRKLPDGQQLRADRHTGEYVLVEGGAASAVNLEKLGKKLGVLRAWEKLS